jgi:phospholipase C
MIALPRYGGHLAAPSVAAGDSSVANNDKNKNKTAIPLSIKRGNISENIHWYFATYPNAGNPCGEPKFNAKNNTPSINGLREVCTTLNPNL